MTKEKFHSIVDSVQVRYVKGESCGLFLSGITHEELAEIITLAGAHIGAMPENAILNPDWICVECSAESPMNHEQRVPNEADHE